MEITIKFDYTSARLADGTEITGGFRQIGRVFTGDLVELKDEKICLVKSNIKTRRIVGRLIFNDNAFYQANRAGHARYRFQPIDKHWPTFLVVSRENLKIDHWVVIEYLNWLANEAVPYGNLVRLIGPIGDYQSEIMARVYYRELDLKPPHIDLRQYHQADLSEFDPVDYFGDQLRHHDLTNLKVFSIDPPKCRDIDDAFSCFQIDDGYRLMVHIADVAFYLEKLNLDINLFKPSSIYLPLKTYNMLPNFLANNWASLLPEQRRLAWTIFWDFKAGQFSPPVVKRTVIRSQRALTYEEAEKLDDPMIELLKIICTQINSHKCQDTHQLIENLMVFTNNQMAQYMTERPLIYRAHRQKTTQFMSNYQPLNEVMKRLSSEAAFYTSQKQAHASLASEAYIHFTSPLRRKVDLYHHLLLAQRSRSTIDVEAINLFNQKQKRLARDIELLDLVFKSEAHPSIKQTIFIIDRPDSTNEHLLTAYLVKKALVIDFEPFNLGLNEIIKLENQADQIVIKNLNTGQKLTYAKYQPIEVNIYLYPDAVNFYQKLIIQLPDIASLIINLDPPKI